VEVEGADVLIVMHDDEMVVEVVMRCRGANTVLHHHYCTTGSKVLSLYCTIDSLVLSLYCTVLYCTSTSTSTVMYY
jgi:hypothetical protein